jgi:(1->4)-alpha-D-glucan 1-alpha-D-glucosylmutase
MRIPASTYRIQFHSGFSFAAAQNIISYLVELGISDLYASPIFKARAGSTHGYDVVDPTQINPELGTIESFNALIDDLHSHKLGWVQDIVPNHMAYDSQNQWLFDILENGSDSEFIDFFDINWNHAYENIKGRVLAPLLGNFYGTCLENGEIQLKYDETGLSVNYFSLKLPVRVESYASFLTHNLGQLARNLGRHHPDFIKLLGILYLIKSAPSETKGKERYDQIAFIRGLLWELYQQNSDVKEFIEKNLEDFNGSVGSPESFNLLDALLSEQFYRLSFWKVGAEEINYRRFFTVNELISLKVEEIKVFHKVHGLIAEYVESGKFTGLRIDHIDGLYDPTQYLERLKEKVGDVYITVEKILELKEDLPEFWPIQGSSGYDFLTYVNNVFCCNDNEDKFQSIYADFTRQGRAYDDLVAGKKRLIIEKNLAGDVDNLAQILKRICNQSRLGSDFTAYGLKTALTEVLAYFPIYRTYINSQEVSQSDRSYIQIAVEKAKKQVPLLLNELNYIETILLRNDKDLITTEQAAERLNFVMRFQQLTGPLMAKGVEDTLLYVYNRLLSLNEVGGHPGHFGIDLTTFHEFNAKRCNNWPHAMSATATHDTKRGEDVRARLNVLSEIPDEWRQNLTHWHALNKSKKVTINKRTIPDNNDEYFLYQTLIGAFPFSQDEHEQFIQRVKDYVIKAVREAKVHTAWLRPDSQYEEAYIAFVDALLQDPQSNEFLQAFLPFQQKIAAYGIYNSLAQTLLKNTAPGIPDLYQGAELWDLSLVDPDNRRPVDYDLRRSYLQDIQEKDQNHSLALIENLLECQEDGRLKLFLTFKLLQARKTYFHLFQKGDYQPLEAVGTYANHVITFARQHGSEIAIAIAPRFLTSLIQPDQLPLGDSIWGDTYVKLPSQFPSSWRNAITSEPLTSTNGLSLSSALQHFPVALLISN